MRSKLFIGIVIMALVFIGTPAMAVDANGWVDGENNFSQWQDTNFSTHTGGTSGGLLYGNSQQSLDMWGGAGAGIGDPTTYVSEVIQGQHMEVSHDIPGGSMSYTLDEIQQGFIDITANPGQEKGISVGGVNNAHADLSSSLNTWKNTAACNVPADNGAVMSSEGSMSLDMSGWVSGVEEGDTGAYKSQVFQQIGHEQSNPIPGGTMSSFSQAIQLGTIDIKVAP